jgi:hypothetical protein
LYELASEIEREQYGLQATTLAGPIALPAGRREGLRQVHELTADWKSRLEPLAGSLEAFLTAHGGPQGTIPQR